MSLLLAGTAAAQQYPQPAAGAQEAVPGVDYPVPPDAPRGGVRVMSYGVTDVRPEASGTSTRALQVRVLLSNDADDTPWTFDTRQALVIIAGQGQSRPAFVNTDGGRPPLLRIARGEHRTVDLYYPLPEALVSAGSAPAFELAWQVQTGAGVFAERTPFNPAGADPGYAQQPQAPPAPPEYDYSDGYGADGGYAYAPPPTTWVAPTFGFAIGLGPVWWSDPFYPRYTFYTRPLIVAGGYWPYRRLVFVAPYRPFYGAYVYRPFYGRYGYRPYVGAWGFRRPYFGGYGYRYRPYGGYGYRGGFVGRPARPAYRGGVVGRPASPGYRGGSVGRPASPRFQAGAIGRPVSPGFRGGAVGRPAMSPGFRGGSVGRAAPSPGFRGGRSAPTMGGMRGIGGGGFRGGHGGGRMGGGGARGGGHFGGRR